MPEFLCEFCKIFKNTIFIGHLRTSGSEKRYLIVKGKLLGKVLDFCVCVKFQIPFFTICLRFCSSCDFASRVRNIRASHVWDFGPCHNVKSHVCYDLCVLSENGFGHFKEQLKRQTRFVLKKKLLVILCSAV